MLFSCTEIVLHKFCRKMHPFLFSEWYESYTSLQAKTKKAKTPTSVLKVKIIFNSLTICISEAKYQAIYPRLVLQSLQA